MTTPMPALEFAPAPCPECGAVNATEAETKCTATQQMSGDYECASTDRKEDAAGNFLFPTAESLAALDAWYDEQGRKDDAEETAARARFDHEVWPGCANLDCLPFCTHGGDGRHFCQRYEEAFSEWFRFERVPA